MDFLNNWDELIDISKRVSIYIGPHQLLEGIRCLHQFEPGIADAAHFIPVDQRSEQPTPVLGRIKPVNRFLPKAQIVQADCSNVRLWEAKNVPGLFHLGDRRDKLWFTIRIQAFAETPDVDGRSFGVVVWCYVDLDSNGIVDGLAGGHNDVAKKHDDKKGGKIALHFKLGSGKLN